MLIKTDLFKDVCSKILSAIDNNEISTLTETLELKTVGKTLFLNVTNKEYYASVKFDLDHEEEFHATVNANLFLKLVAQITAENIKLTIYDTYVELVGNGVYKIPLIFDGDALLELPEIVINNKTATMPISGTILQSILNYNSKELLKGTVAKPVQKMFYVDEEGCITFTSGACVNSFALAQPIKLLLTSRLVKLFKLFKNDMVTFTLGYDALSTGIIQTKVCFETSSIKLTSILSCDDTLLNSVPVKAIRGRANNAYAYSVSLNRQELIDAINRLLLFSAGYGSRQTVKPYSLFEFDGNNVTIWDANKENMETLIFENNLTLATPYSMTLDLIDFKTVLDGCTEQSILLNFGDHKAAVLVRGNIKNVIPEVNTVKN